MFFSEVAIVLLVHLHRVVQRAGPVQRASARIGFDPNFLVFEDETIKK
jgi:hypothetical protein